MPGSSKMTYTRTTEVDGKLLVDGTKVIGISDKRPGYEYQIGLEEMFPDECWMNVEDIRDHPDNGHFVISISFIPDYKRSLDEE